MLKHRRKWKCARAIILITSFVFLWKPCTIANWLRSGNYFGLLSRRVCVRYVASDDSGGVNESHNKRCTQLPLASKSLTYVRTARRSKKISNLVALHKICDSITSYQRQRSLSFNTEM